MTLYGESAFNKKTPLAETGSGGGIHLLWAAGERGGRHDKDMPCDSDSVVCIASRICCCHEVDFHGQDF